MRTTPEEDPAGVINERYPQIVPIFCSDVDYQDSAGSIGRLQAQVANLQHQLDHVHTTVCRIQADMYSGPQGIAAASFKPPVSPNPPEQLCPPLPIDAATQYSVEDYPEGTTEAYLSTIYEEHNPAAATVKSKNPDDEHGRWTDQSSTRPVLSVAAARMVDSEDLVPHPCNPSYQDYRSHPNRFGYHALGTNSLQPWVPMGCHQLE
jgi:hypothetical protein